MKFSDSPGVETPKFSTGQWKFGTRLSFGQHEIFLAIFEVIWDEMWQWIPISTMQVCYWYCNLEIYAVSYAIILGRTIKVWEGQPHVHGGGSDKNAISASLRRFCIGLEIQMLLLNGFYWLCHFVFTECKILLAVTLEVGHSNSDKFLDWTVQLFCCL